MSQYLGDSRWLTNCPSVFLYCYVNVSIFDSFKLIEIAENIDNFGFGLDFNNNLFDFFRWVTGFAHEHNTNFIHEIMSGLLIYFSFINFVLDLIV